MKANGSTYGLQLPMGDAEDSTQVILPFYSQAGGSVLNEAGDGFDLDNQAMVDALDYYASFFTEGLSPLSGYGDSQNSAFVDGSDPAFISGPWMVNVLADLQGEDWVEQNVATVPVPAAPPTTTPTSAARTSRLRRGQERRRRLEAHPLALRARDAAGVVRRDERPARAEQRVGLRGAHLEPPHQVLQEQLENTIAPPTVPSWDELSATIETEAEKVANGQVSSEDAAKAIQAKADTLGLGW